MSSMFFSPGGRLAGREVNSEIIRKLVDIRLSGCNIVKINRDILETDYSSIKKLVQLLGEDILRANIIEAGGLDTYKEARSKFFEMTENFIINSNKYNIILYAAQLLQYYTIICSDDLPEIRTYEKLDKFLAEKIEKFGDASRNIFIVEYKLLKIYNELSTVADPISGNIAPIQNTEEKLLLLIDYLRELQAIVNEFKRDAPDNVFSHYLDFVSNYTAAKVMELNYRIHDTNPIKLSPEKQLQLSEAQQNYLADAKAALDEIEKLNDYFKERGITHVKGFEFSLGQGFSGKLPISNLEKFKDHVASLLV